MTESKTYNVPCVCTGESAREPTRLTTGRH